MSLVTAVAPKTHEGGRSAADVCSEANLSSARSTVAALTFQQQCEGFTQLEPVAGGVCEEESTVRNKASILELSAASRSFSCLSSFVRCSMS